MGGNICHDLGYQDLPDTLPPILLQNGKTLELTACFCLAPPRHTYGLTVEPYHKMPTVGLVLIELLFGRHMLLLHKDPMAYGA